MVSLLALSVVVRGFEPCLVKPKTIKLVFVASLLSTQPSVVRANTARFGIRSVCQSGAKTKLPNSEQSSKGKVKIHKYINRQNQSTTGKL
jgi:hypothetical protein